MKAACLLVGLALVTAGCTADYGDENQSPVLVHIVSITASAGGGGTGSGVGTVLHSDVLSNATVFNDNASLIVQNTSKNQRGNLIPGELNDVIIERYEVAYLRSDGRNTQGVDVPYTITGPVDSIVLFGGQTTIPITVVRQQAKLEPPLMNLRQGGGAILITASAQITLHGRTLSGKSVQARGQLQITFADFGDQ